MWIETEFCVAAGVHGCSVLGQPNLDLSAENAAHGCKQLGLFS
jgi:hypothetical protein